MKVKIRPQNLPKERKDVLDEVSREYVDMKKNEIIDSLKYKFSRRFTCALCLSLNDNYGFGGKRAKWVIESVNEIINGVCDDIYDKNEIDPEGRDKMLENMMDELDNRGFYIVFEDDPNYDSNSIPERKARKRERMRELRKYRAK